MLKAVCTQAEFEALSEAEKAHYERDGARHFLQVRAVTIDGADGAKATFALENIAGMQSALGRLKNEHAQLKAKVADYETRFKDLDPDEARTAIEKVKEIGDAGSDEARKREIDALRASVEAQYKKQIAALEGIARSSKEKAEKYAAHIRQSRIEAAATAAIEAERGSVALLLPHVVARCRVVADPSDPDNPDLYTVEVVDSKGQPRYSTKQGSAGGPMGPAEYVAELKGMDTFAVAFEGARAAGSGASGSSSSRATGRTIRASDRAAIEANIDRIAKGEVTVVDG
jgi:hypothetical protein